MRPLSLSLVLIFLFSGCSLIYKHEKSKVISIQTPRTVGAITLPTIIQEDIGESVGYDKYQPEQTGVQHNKKLQEIMRKFDYLIFTKINSEVESGEEDMFFGKNTRKLLKEFIRDTKVATSLYPNADETYIKFSKRLEKEATKLYKIVKIKKMDWVKPQVENVINVCNGCHAIYRL
jgi:hypothetical protein